MAKRILIVDDDPNIVDYLTTLLQDHGYETSGALSGMEGLEIARSLKPDLITLDLQMPQEWGPRFFRRLMQESELKHIPIIVISGLSGAEYAIPKAVACLGKPFDPEALLRIVRERIGAP